MGKQIASPAKQVIDESSSSSGSSSNHVIITNSRPILWFIFSSVCISFWLGYYSQSSTVLKFIWGEPNYIPPVNNNDHNAIEGLPRPEFNDSLNYNQQEENLDLIPSPTMMETTRSYLNGDANENIDLTQRREQSQVFPSNSNTPKQQQLQHIFNVEYYETLVHPAMFTHENPERIGIVISSGDDDSSDDAKNCKIGGMNDHLTSIVTQVLKHKTVKEVSIIGVTSSSSIDLEIDSRIKLVNQQPLEWFTGNYTPSESDEDEGEEDEENIDDNADNFFDVLILDLFDSRDPFKMDSLVYNIQFVEAIKESMDDYSVLVSQTGIAPRISDPDETYSQHSTRVKFIDALNDFGFEKILNYEVGRSGMASSPVSFLVALESSTSVADWFSSEAKTSLKMQQRLVDDRTKEDGLLLQYFDGATMIQYQYPSKASEVVYCRQQNKPAGCLREYNGGRGFNMEWPNYKFSDLEVRRSTVGENAGRGVFAAVDIRAQAYLGLESSDMVFFEPDTHDLASDLPHSSKLFRDSAHAVLNSYMYGYGYQSSAWGKVMTSVEPGPLTFVNHGCNGTTNIDFVEGNITEWSVSLDSMPAVLTDSHHAYDPATAHIVNQVVTTHLDVKKGDEIFGNYLTYIEDPESWAESVQELRDDCSGAIGAVERYQVGQKIYERDAAEL